MRKMFSSKQIKDIVKNGIQDGSIPVDVPDNIVAIVNQAIEDGDITGLKPVQSDTLLESFKNGERYCYNTTYETYIFSTDDNGGTIYGIKILNNTCEIYSLEPYGPSEDDTISTLLEDAVWVIVAPYGTKLYKHELKLRTSSHMDIQPFVIVNNDEEAYANIEQVLSALRRHPLYYVIQSIYTETTPTSSYFFNLIYGEGSLTGSVYMLRTQVSGTPSFQMNKIEVFVSDTVSEY